MHPDTEHHFPIYYIYPYKDPDIKARIRRIKLLDAVATRQAAADIHNWLVHAVRSKNILILHAPSSAFSLRQRSQDQLSMILDHMAEIQQDALRIDIWNHFFLIDMNKRSAQHAMNRSDRLKASESKFSILHPISLDFISRYDAVIILDDVCTTGTTLRELSITLHDAIGNALYARMKRKRRPTSETHHIPAIYALAYAH